MTAWAIFYLVCFLVGVTLTVLSFLGGSLHLPHVHVHLPHGGHIATPHVEAGPHAPAGHGPEMSFVNFATITAFLTWFGGSGYLLTRHTTLMVSLIMLLAVATGLIGSTIIFGFIAKVLIKHDRELDPADYERVGVLGRIISPVHKGGTGEIIFSQEGTRHTCGARSESGEALARDTEVIITRYEHGIAYVRRWEEMANGKEAANSSLSS
jgi:membrane protein implicated in regulation of membrane protease activity